MPATTRKSTPGSDAAFTMKTHVHVSDQDLREDIKTLACIHKIA